MPRELRSMQRVIDESEKLGMSKEEVVDAVSKSWGKSDSEAAAQAIGGAKWKSN
jgi:hypothetical protein